MKSFLALSALMAVASAVGLLVPFYEYPYGDDAVSDWNALISSIDAHPSLSFYVIINIDNGGPYSPNPPEGMKDFAVWIDKLNSRSNAYPIGYVQYASSNSASVVKEAIDNYYNWTTSAGWSSTAQYDIRMDGIFLDSIDTDPSKLAHNTEITKYAKATFDGRSGPIVLNPGVFVRSGSESLFDLADSIVQIETCYTNSSGATDSGSVERCAPGTYTPFTDAMLEGLGDASQIAKSSVIVHDFYDSWSPYSRAALANLESSVEALTNKGLHSFYVSLFGYTGDFTVSPASIMNVATYASKYQG